MAKQFSYQMRSFFFLIISIAIGFSILYFQPDIKIDQNQVKDTEIRQKLLNLKKNGDISVESRFLPSKVYSKLIYDYEITADCSGPLPDAENIIPDRYGYYKQTFRVKLPFKTNFTLKKINKKGDYNLKLINSLGLIIFDKSDRITIPSESVILEPDIYILEARSRFPLKCIDVTCKIEANNEKPDHDFDKPRPIRLTIGANELSSLQRMVRLALNSTGKWIIKMPEGRVKGLIHDQFGKAAAKIRIGLSGRSREHLSGFPSIDVKVKGGKSYDGLTSFKLYRLSTKSGLYDLIILSVLKDMGFPVPRQDVVRLIVNDENLGLYILTETPSPAMFANQCLAEGNIVGTDLSKMFFDYPYGARLEARHFYQVKDYPLAPLKNDSFTSYYFPQKVNQDYLAKYIALSSLYLSIHGLGVDDLRFYNDPYSDTYFPIPRDLNPSLAGSLRFINLPISNLAWWLSEPTYTIWPLRNLIRGTYSFDRSRDISILSPQELPLSFCADIHFVISSFLAEAKNLKAVNEELSYFANSKALYNLIWLRLKNTLQTCIKHAPQNEIIKKQLTDLSSKGITTLNKLVADTMITEKLVFNYKSKNYKWNIRTSPDLNRNFAPSFFAPFLGAMQKADKEQQLSLAFLTEFKIFDILKKKGLFVTDSFQIDNETSSSTIIPVAASLKKKVAQLKNGWPVLDNIVTVLGKRQLDESTVLQLFLVRNATQNIKNYKLLFRDRLQPLEPVVNEYFTLDNSNISPDRKKSDLVYTILNLFQPGETFRLLGFKINLEDEALFYSLEIPSQTFLAFPPYMYFPSRSARPRIVNSSYSHLFSKKEDGFHLDQGKQITIYKHILLPKGEDMHIHAGAIIYLQPDSSLTIQGNLFIKGRKDKRVILKAIGNNSAAGIYVQGNPLKHSKIEIEYADFYNFGAWPRTKTAISQMNGGIGFYYSNIDISQVTIENSLGEDGLNCFRSNLNISGLIIINSYSDALDLDFCEAEINNLYIEKAGGDGLDLSGSLVKCSNSSFIKAGDKGISVGERSHIFVSSSNFTDNEIGIANKDQSLLHLSESFFKNNKQNLAEYVKKPYFGEPLKRGTPLKRGSKGPKGGRAE